MIDSATVLTREALYALVWAEPMSKLAPRYGLSDRGLAKVCESRNIPVPPRGYWAKLTHRHKAKQPPLPPWTGNGDGSIHLRETMQPPKPVEPLPQEIEFERQPENVILVPERLGRMHPLVSRTKQLLKGVKPGDRGLLHVPAGALDLRVAPGSLPRALRIMQGLVSALADRGYTVVIDAAKRITTADVMGEKIACRLLERTKRVTAKPNDYRWKYVKEGWNKDEPTDLVPSGRFVLEIGSGYPTPAVEDRNGRQIEERLNDFVVKLIKEASREKRWRQEHERQEAMWREQERLRAIQEEKRREEQKKIDQWDAWMKAWRRAREVRAFARAIRRQLGALQEGSQMAGWLSWAEGYAERIDPLRASQSEHTARENG